MSKRTHVLKTWPEPFQAIMDGRKCYEVRRDDRGYAVGDTLHLREWEPSGIGRLTGREVKVVVLYMTPGGAWGMPSGLCVMSIVHFEPVLP